MIEESLYQFRPAIAHRVSPFIYRAIGSLVPSPLGLYTPYRYCTMHEQELNLSVRGLEPHIHYTIEPFHMERISWQLRFRRESLPKDLSYVIAYGAGGGS